MYARTEGALFSEGTCHWQGTVTCPYHGWVYDEEGNNVAVLGEGPDSGVQGKVGTEARVYPTRTLKGVVFIWMGEDDPAPIEEDVPEEFFDPDTRIFFNDTIYWKTNWEVGLENSMDAHVNYLHRDHLQAMLGNPSYMPRGASGSRVAFTGNGFKSMTETPENPPQDIYSELGWKWPKHRFRTIWSWIFNPFFKATSVPPSPTKSERWSMGHRLPGMFRAGVAPTGSTERVPRPRGGGLFGLYTRWTVPVRRVADQGLVLPFDQAFQPHHIRLVLASLLDELSLACRVQLLATGHERYGEPALRLARKAVRHRRRGRAVETARSHQTLRRTKRRIRAPTSGSVGLGSVDIL